MPALQEIPSASESPAQEEVRSPSEWKRLWRSIGGVTRTLEHDLERLIADYANDVAGGFNKQVHTFASQVVPPALSLFCRRKVRSSCRFICCSRRRCSSSWRTAAAAGPLDKLQRSRRTARWSVCVPTHPSNLDGR